MASFHIVQLDCGGMHTVALTEDNKIVTWGVNDNGALGRDTAWDGMLREADGDSDAESEMADMNPFETTPTQIPSNRFPPWTRFVQVAAGDSCSFALSDTGLVFGWGTFVVRLFEYLVPAPMLPSNPRVIEHRGKEMLRLWHW
jgi:regulator of chromosome condensation